MAVVIEWLNLLVRWVHVIAAIMWVGDSFLFMWLDSHLSQPTKTREGTVVGELWMTHSGGFYEVIKRKSLGELPPTIYWFKWESYTTWISGFCLLCIVYYAGGAAFLIDPQVSALTKEQAIGLSLGLLPLGFVVYELMWRSPLARDQRVFGLFGFGLLLGLVYALTHLFSGRAAFLEVGAVIGTTMAANVFFRIIPAQKYMIAATKAGQPVDTTLGLRAKGRSIHNNYLTLPVLFTMLSNHFPTTYGNGRPWLVMGCLFVFGAGLKYVMNFRARSHPVVIGGLVTALAGFMFLTAPRAAPLPGLETYANAKSVSFATVNSILQTRCVNCHAAKPTSSMFAAAPQGLMLETPDQIAAHADRVYLLSVATKTMPLGNITGISQAERDVIGAWVAQGANVNAPGPVELPTTPEVAAANADADATAKEIFATRCVACHGDKGDGQGVAAAGLPVKPRAYTDPLWQASVTDAYLKQVIVAGGAALGKSPLMPGNPDLETQPAVAEALVRTIRAFKVAGDGGSP